MAHSEIDNRKGKLNQRVDVVSLIRDAYANIPFYKWFYEKKKFDLSEIRYEEVPVLTKRDLFEYEAETKEPYDGIKNPEGRWSLLTSGTTGKPLRVAWDIEDVKLWASRILNGLKPVFEPSYRYIGIKFPDFVGISQIYRGFENNGVNGVQIPNERAADFEYMTEKIKGVHPNFIFDLSGRWVSELVQKNFPLSEQGIRAASVMTVDRSEEETIRAAGVQIVKIFGCIELGVIGSNCPTSKDFHTMDLGMLHVIDETGKLKDRGEGKLIATGVNKIFPFIKYWNGDLVRLYDTTCTCGFQGVNLSFLGRKNEIKIPDASGAYVDFNLLQKGFEKELKVTPRFIYMKAERNSHRFNMVVVIIPSDSECLQLLPTHWSQKAMFYGTGAVNDNFLFAIPVIRVPRSMLSILVQRKERHFLTIEGGVIPDGYQPLIDAISALLEVKVIHSAGKQED